MSAVLAAGPSASFEDAGPGRRSLRERLVALADGFAWPLTISHYLELANPLWFAGACRARVDDVIVETATARTLVLRPGRGWRRHRAGQFVAVGVTVDGARHTRTYSIASPPEREDGRVTITVQALPGGRVSQRLVHDLGPGAYVTLGAPQGDFVLPDATPVRPLFVTAGSGITPVMSMLRSFAAQGGIPDVVHLHYAPRAGEVIFGAELARLARENPRYRLRVVETRGATDGNLRHLSAAALEAWCPDWRRRDVWACGPEPLLDAAEGIWNAAGFPGRLRIERFRARRAAPPVGGVRAGRVRFVRSGRTAASDGTTPLLRVAEDAGLAPAHGCRIGICHTCTARLVSGCVRDVRNHHVTDEPGAAIQLCVSAASGDVDIEV